MELHGQTDEASGVSEAEAQAMADAAEAAAIADADAALTAHEGAADPHTGYQKESEKGQTNGYASLDGSGTVPDAQLPAALARDAEVTSAVSTAISNHEADTTAHPAANITVDSTNLDGIGTDLQTVLEELEDQIGVGGGGTALTVEEDGVAVDVTVDTLDFEGDDFNVTEPVEDTAYISISAAIARVVDRIAANVTVDSTDLVGTGTDLQTVLEELDDAIANHIADAVAAHAASAISVADSGAIFAGGDVEAVLAELGNRERVYAYRTTNQSINASSWIALSFDSERFDTASMHEAVTNPTRLTLPTAGVYLVMGNYQMIANGTGTRWIGIRKNGAGSGPDVAIFGPNPASATFDARMFVAGIVLAAANDYVELYVYQDSGAARNVKSASGGADFDPWFAAVRLA